MSDTNAQAQKPAIKPIKIEIPKKRADMATIIGMFISFALIGVALFLGGSPDAFFDFRSFLIVFCGTIAVTSISFTGADFLMTFRILGKSMFRHDTDPQALGRQLLNIATSTRQHGVLSLQKMDKELKKDDFLYRGVQMVSDGSTSDEISYILGQEIDALIMRHAKGVSILRRAAETAPAMGLIGTLIGLVQMLAMLDDPSTIGPSMAVALLTTFYGALLGTIICTPLAAKLNAKSQEETLIKTLILIALGSISRQENPRRLEMMLNSELPPALRIKYFK